MEKNTPQPPKCPRQEELYEAAKKQGREDKYKNSENSPPIRQPNFGY